MRPLRSSIIQRLNICLPHRCIHTDNVAIIRHHAVHLALHIRSLRPHTARASEEVDLLAQLAEKVMGSVVPPLCVVGKFVGGLLTQVLVPGTRCV